MRTQLVLGLTLSLMAGAAAAQTATPTADPGQAGPRAQAAKFVLDRGTGEGRFEIDCAQGDTTRACVEAALPLLDGLPDGGGAGTGVIFAGTSIKCGNTVYEVTTGTTGGNCTVGGSGTGPYTNTTCTDGRNEITASCSRGCGASQGSGNCTIKGVN